VTFASHFLRGREFGPAFAVFPFLKPLTTLEHLLYTLEFLKFPNFSPFAIKEAEKFTVALSGVMQPTMLVLFKVMLSCVWSHVPRMY
jgi:hypothetical protein